MHYQFTLSENLCTTRLDKALSNLLPDISRSQIQKSIKAGLVILNGIAELDSGAKVKPGDEVDFALYEENISALEPAEMPLDIVYEDQHLIVINKPAGLTTHPGVGNHQDTLANALAHYTQTLSDIGGEFRPGIVHRLDKDTSGLMVVAKNNYAHAKLAEQIQARQLTRKYKAIIWGMMLPPSGVICGNIARSKIDRTKMTIVKTGGKTAVTHYRTEEIFQAGKLSLIECTLETGRTHQIRVHLSHAGHSLLGDQTYGQNTRKLTNLPLALQEALENFKRQALHSWYLQFHHPVTQEVLEFSCDFPEDLQGLLERIR